MKHRIYLISALLTLSGVAQAEIVEYVCIGGQPLRIEFAADGSTATPLNHLGNAAIAGMKAVAQKVEGGVSYKFAPAAALPMTIVGPSRSKLNVTYGRRTFDCEAKK
jgi:hypothetical protein